MSIADPTRRRSRWARADADVEAALLAATEALLEVGAGRAAVALAMPGGTVEEQRGGRSGTPLPEALDDLAAGLLADPDMPLAGGIVAGAVEVGDGGRVVAVARPRPGVEAEAVRVAAEAAALGVARAALLRRGRSHSGQLERLLATARRVAESLELETVLGAIVRDAAVLLGADSGEMLLWDEGRRKLRVAAAWELPGDIIGYEMPFGEGLSSQVILQRRTLQVDDYATYEHRVHDLDRIAFRAILGAPLLVRGSPIGVLNVHAISEGHRFRPGDADLLSAFAGHAAIAVDHARRYDNEVRLGRQLASTNAELVRSLTLQRRLAEQVVTGAGHAGLAGELAAALGRPVVIQDHLWRVMAGASPPGSNADWGALTSPRPSAGRGRDQGEAGSPERQAVPVRVGREVVGHITFGSEDRLGPLDRALIDVAATGAALEFARLRAAVDVEQRVRGEFGSDLVAGTFGSDEAIAARAARLGYDLGEPRDLLLIDLVEDDQAEPAEAAALEGRRRLTEHLAESLLHRRPGSFVFGLGRSIVVLATTRGSEPPRAGDGTALAVELQALAARLDPAVALVIGVGDRCTEAADYAPSFRLARSSLDAMGRLGRRPGIVGARELGALRPLLAATAPEELRAFARRTLAPLVDGSRVGPELLATLRAWIDEGQVQRRAAQRCFVHVNTVVYRLKRVEELLGCSLDDPATIFELTLALRILELDPAVGTGDPFGRTALGRR
ncbi:MAG TPA: helix-turn-helix domain-containing protein [Candidatus Limnocylindrales bacterium]|nr:helix-turn-helix domain-containing protein [Candidatus Limnocylindrales bacterium]